MIEFAIYLGAFEGDFAFGERYALYVFKRLLGPTPVFVLDVYPIFSIMIMFRCPLYGVLRVACLPSSLFMIQNFERLRGVSRSTHSPNYSMNLDYAASRSGIAAV
jgi:hypothetical protein